MAINRVGLEIGIRLISLVKEPKVFIHGNIRSKDVMNRTWPAKNCRASNHVTLNSKLYRDGVLSELKTQQLVKDFGEVYPRLSLIKDITRCSLVHLGVV
ncbi:hypothetical protein Vadar_011266 [Vaccinium darrowii]|uniref:Uncharacterized protein n=1 Tax=Vaccinium darrowii TaxID=229202 RepID=A0ACB7ZAX9_9ERIC|nr:hypothetical protein Vadar_011266 [Vaccinium darrowii]